MDNRKETEMLTVGKSKYLFIKIVLFSIFLFHCKEDKKANSALENKGIGPIRSVILGEIDPVMVEKGKKTFETKCTSCHRIGKKYIGPDLTNITGRRSPEWIMNMILNPEEMTQKDSIAQELLLEAAGAQMVSQDVSESEARELLEYFRQTDSKK